MLLPVTLPCFFHRGMCGTRPLSTPAYRDKLAVGIANGILTYLDMDSVKQPESGGTGSAVPLGQRGVGESRGAGYL